MKLAPASFRHETCQSHRGHVISSNRREPPLPQHIPSPQPHLSRRTASTREEPGRVELVPAVILACQNRRESGRNLVTIGRQLGGGRLALLKLLNFDGCGLHLEEGFQRLTLDEDVGEVPEERKLSPNAL